MPKTRKFATDIDFTDLQSDIDEYFDDMEHVTIRPSWTGTDEDSVDMSYLFQELVRLQFGNDTWTENLRLARIPTLGRIANLASNFGLDNLADLIRKHIALRKLPFKHGILCPETNERSTSFPRCSECGGMHKEKKVA